MKASVKTPQRIALIGHRGVGKTSLLSRIESAYRSVGRRIRSFDLDKEIAQNAGRSVSSIFQDDGEAVFRRLETSTFEKLEREVSKITDDVVIALGAGYPVGLLPPAWRAVWIRRPTDEIGRVFTDRPRLDNKVSALEEFHARRTEREPRFAARANDILILDEGLEDAVGADDKVGDSAERDYFLDRLNLEGAALTVMPDSFSRDFETWAEKRASWNIRWFELRDDLLAVDQMKMASQFIPRERVLISFRDRARTESTRALVDSLSCAFDWPAEWGQCHFGKPDYLSFHSSEAVGGEVTDQAVKIQMSLDRLTTASLSDGSSHSRSSDQRTQLKAALTISNFEELMMGHKWQQADPARRIFLPMSPDGRWNWYRQLRTDYSLNFIRESSGSASDQPTLLQWARRRTNNSKSFAAVLGDPVAHSRTPMEHATYFHKQSMSVFAIRVSEDEWKNGALDDLITLGLTHAAITAPLKKQAYEFTAERAGGGDGTVANLSDAAVALSSVNTMKFPQRKTETSNLSLPSAPIATNTDLFGLKTAAELNNLPQTNCAVWGGGGTLDVILRVFPPAQAYSVRTGQPRNEGEAARSPDLVIWAATSSQSESPPKEWKPKIIFDLNYSEASSGRDYALKTGAKYISGLAMFKAQAQAQRDFWSRLPDDRLKEN